MSWSDEELDELFKDAAGKQSFDFNDDYWKDIEAQLPVNKGNRRGIMWWITGGSSILLVLTVFLVQQQERNTEVVSETSILSGSVKLTAVTGQGGVQTGNTEKEQDLLSFGSTQSKGNDQGIKLPVSKKESTDRVQASVRDEDYNALQNDRVEMLDNSMAEDIPVVNNLTESLMEGKEVGTLTFSDNRLIPFSFSNGELLNGPVLYSVRSWDLYAEIYGGIGQSWKKAEEGQNVSASYGVRFGMLFPFGRFSLSTGLGFGADAFDNLLIRERTKVYGFGAVEIENSYRFKTVYSLSLPVRFTTRFGRHEVSLNADPTVRLFSTVQSACYQDGVRLTYSSGVTDVSFFNSLGLRLGLGYAFNVKEDLQLILNAGSELLDNVRSERIIGNNTQMPFSVQMGIRRTFGK